MGTAAAAGVYENYGAAWGQIVQQTTGRAVIPVPTQGPSENIYLMHRQTPLIDLSMVSMGIARDAWYGEGIWTQGRPHRKMRALFPMYQAAFHGVALRRNGIERLVQLQHKTIGVGPRGSTSGTYFPAMMNTLGVPISTTRYGEGVDLSWQLKEGLLDAFLFASGLPTPYFDKLAGEADITFLGFSEPELDWLKAVYPETYSGRIPENTYHNDQRKEVHALCTFNFAVCLESLDEDLVYSIVKGVMSNQLELKRQIEINSRDPVLGKQLGNLAYETTPANCFRNSFLPYHQGAIQYFRELGLQPLQL